MAKHFEACILRCISFLAMELQGNYTNSKFLQMKSWGLSLLACESHHNWFSQGLIHLLKSFMGQALLYV